MSTWDIQFLNIQEEHKNKIFKQIFFFQGSSIIISH